MVAGLAAASACTLCLQLSFRAFLSHPINGLRPEQIRASLERSYTRYFRIRQVLLTENQGCVLFFRMLQNPPSGQVAGPPNDPVSPPRSALLISRVTLVLVLLLAAGSFTISYEALSELAAASGAVDPSRAWVFALLVDGAIVIFSISALRATVAGESDRWSMTLVITTTAASILLNIAHARPGPVGWLVGAMPPMLLFLSFESCMKQLGARYRPPSRPVRPSVRKASPKAPQTRSSSPRMIELQGRQERARTLLRSGMPRRAVAREAGLALSTVRRIASGLESQSASA
jgi:hypothetical protein